MIRIQTRTTSGRSKTLVRRVVVNRHYFSTSRLPAPVLQEWTALIQTTRSQTRGLRWKSTTAEKNTSNIFLDNLGKLFLAGIGLVIASLVRSYYGQNNKNRKRDQLEDEAPIDPIELNELRFANQGILDYAKFVQIVNLIYQETTENENGTWDYRQFTYRVRNFLQNDSIQLGHYLDRVYLKYAEQQHQDSDQFSPRFFCVLLSLSLHGSIPERVSALYHILQKEGTTLQNVRAIVQDLQNTYQLPPDTQIVPVAHAKYPIQQYERGQNLLQEWRGEDQDPIDLDAFNEILRSRAVCAWGECYHKKKF